MMMQKFKKEIPILVCKMEKVFPPGWFNAMQHFLMHLPWEAKVGGPVQFRWMYSQERELKKLRAIVCNKARAEGCIAEAFTCKEITNFSSIYFSHDNNVNAHTSRYHIEEVVPLSELKIGECGCSNSARKVVKDAIKHGRFQSIAYYHRNVLKQPMNARQAKALNLYL
jgi:hypothetical protein